MSETAQRSALARILAAHQGLGDNGPDTSADLAAGLSRAIRMASIPFEGLFARPDEVSVTRATTLSETLEALPDTGLLAAIEDQAGRRGLIAMGHLLVDALIEVQTTGRVEDAELPPRKITRIDEALCRDFIDLVFAAFARETEKTPGRDWPERLIYGSSIAEKGQLNLLLPEQGYHRLSVDVTVGEGRIGQFLLLLPRDATLARRKPQGISSTPPTRPDDWGKRVLSVLGAAPLSLDAVLMRVTLPLGQVEAMEVGELIPFDPSDLEKVTLEGEGDHVFAHGGLGQLGGKRAVRLGPGPDAGKGTQRASAPAGALGVPGPGGPVPAMATAPEMPGGTNTALPTPEMAGFDPSAPMGDAMAEMPAPGGFDPDAPMADFDPDAPMGGFDPDAPMGGPALEGGGLPDLPMGDFDPNAPMR